VTDLSVRHCSLDIEGEDSTLTIGPYCRICVVILLWMKRNAVSLGDIDWVKSVRLVVRGCRGKAESLWLCGIAKRK
jgi:hypothetical protein